MCGYIGGKAEVKNCVVDANVNSSYCAGGIAGMAGDATVENCQVKGKINASNTQDGHAGGIAGWTYCSDTTTTIKNTDITADVTGAKGVGGFVGFNQSNIEIADSNFNANVNGESCVGGLVGYSSSNDQYKINITNSTVKGSVTGENSVGGFVGEYELGTVEKCTMDADVKGKKDVGGAFGTTDYGNKTELKYSLIQGSVVGQNGDADSNGGYENNNFCGKITGHYYNVTFVEQNKIDVKNTGVSTPIQSAQPNDTLTEFRRIQNELKDKNGTAGQTQITAQSKYGTETYNSGWSKQWYNSGSRDLHAPSEKRFDNAELNAKVEEFKKTGRISIETFTKGQAGSSADKSREEFLYFTDKLAADGYFKSYPAKLEFVNDTLSKTLSDGTKLDCIQVVNFDKYTTKDGYSVQTNDLYCGMANNIETHYVDSKTGNEYVKTSSDPDKFELAVWNKVKDNNTVTKPDTPQVNPTPPINETPKVDDIDTVDKTHHITEAEALAQGYMLIKTADDILKIQKNPKGKFMLMNDIELSSKAWYLTQNDFVFSGELHGNNFAIENKLGYNSNTLFKTIDNAAIKNLELVNFSHDVNHTPRHDAVLAKVAKNSTIENCSVNTGANGNSTTLVTDIYDTKVKNCSVDNKNTEIGAGIIGRAMNSSIENCTYKGLITGSNGAIVSLADNSTVSNCTSSGEIKDCITAGGIVGRSYDSKISDCSSTMTITSGNTGYSAETNLGGIVGMVHSDTEITNCDYSGAITGLNGIGGIVGSCEDADLKINNCNVSGTIEGKRNIGGFVGLLKPSDNNQVRISNSAMSSVIKSNTEIKGKGVCELAGGFINKYDKGDVLIENCTMTGSIEGPCGYAMDNFGFRNGNEQKFDGFERFGFGYMAGYATKSVNNDGTPVFVNCTIKPQNVTSTKPNETPAVPDEKPAVSDTPAVDSTQETKPAEKVYPKYASKEEGNKAAQDFFDSIDEQRKETLSKLADGYGEGNHAVYSYVFEADGKLYEAQREIIASHPKNAVYFPSSYSSRGNFVTEYPASDGLSSYYKETVEKALVDWKKNPNTNPVPFKGTSSLQDAEYFLKYLADKGELGTKFPIDLPVTINSMRISSYTNKGGKILLMQGFTVHIEKYTDENGVEVFYTNYPDAFMSKNIFYKDENGNEYVKTGENEYTLKTEIEQEKTKEKAQVKNSFNSMLSNSAYVQTRRIKSDLFDDKLF